MNWLLWVCEFSRCFKDANEFFGFVLQAQNRSGCCGYWGLKGKKKNECLGWSLWFWESIGDWIEKEMNNEWYEMMKWCEAGRLTRMFDMVLKYGPTKSRKNWVTRSWKHVPNGWGWGNWGILSDEWWMMSDENWVMSDEWWKKKNQIGLRYYDPGIEPQNSL